MVGKINAETDAAGITRYGMLELKKLRFVNLANNKLSGPIIDDVLGKTWADFE